MPKYQITLTSAGNGRYRAVMTDHKDGWKHVFDDVGREVVKGKKVWAGKESGPISLWTVVVCKRDDFYRIDVTDYRFWVIRFDECELEDMDGTPSITGRAERANFLEEMKEKVAA